MLSVCYKARLSCCFGPTDLSTQEHMEDDDETTRTIPPWVNLEYSVRYRP